MKNKTSLNNLSVPRSMIVLDLEANCSECKSTIPRDEMEIIEIGAAVLLDGKVVSKFQLFVKPTLHPQVTEFCTKLTGIKQEDVDPAKDFKGSISDFDKWIVDVQKEHNIEYWGSWGAFDLHSFARNRAVNNMSKKTLIETIPHINLKNFFTEKTGKRMGVGRALGRLGMKFEGNAHRALDDVLNITRIINKVNS